MKTKTFSYNGQRYFIRGRTDAEIAEKLIAKRVELEVQEQLTPKSILVSDWFIQYMATYKTNISPKTYKSYESIYKLLIEPKIGILHLSEVKPIMIQGIFNSMKSYSESYIHKTYILVKSLFEKAYDNDLIERTPTRNLVLPKGTKSERRALTISERQAFLIASDNGRNSGLFCRIIYYCGLRPSEVCRIQGGDYSDGWLHVRGTKTKAATRSVPIPQILQLPELPKGKLMFQTCTENPIEVKRIREYWLAIKRDMHLDPDNDLTMYCLRHDYCTRLEEAGVPLNVASRLMGHSSVEITAKIYTHESEVTLTKAETLINQYFEAVP